MKLSGYSCWDRSTLEDVFPAQAHVQRKSYFLATHSPFKNFKILKEKASIGEKHEADLLERLIDKNTDFELAFIKGAPGTGKSHLIRWIFEEWIRRCPDDKAIFIPRRDATLQGTLEKLIDSLMADDNNYQDLAEKLKHAAFGLNPRGIRNKLIDSLTLTLDVEGLTEDFEGSQDVVDARFVDVLRSPGPRHNLLKDGQVISRITKKILTENRDDEDIEYDIEEFHANDIVKIY